MIVPMLLVVSPDALGCQEKTLHGYYHSSLAPSQPQDSPPPKKDNKFPVHLLAIWFQLPTGQSEPCGTPHRERPKALQAAATVARHQPGAAAGSVAWQMHGGAAEKNHHLDGG